MTMVSVGPANRSMPTEITVEREVQEITTKLGAANRVQAVAEAIGRGVI